MPIRVIANTICLLKNPMNGKICKIAFGNISCKQSYWDDCALFVFVRVISKAITDQRRLKISFMLTNERPGHRAPEIVKLAGN